MRPVLVPGMIKFCIFIALIITGFCFAAGCTTTRDENGRIVVSVVDTSSTPSAGPSATKFIIYTYVTKLRINNTENIPKYNVTIKILGTSNDKNGAGVCAKVEDLITYEVLPPLATRTAQIAFDRDANTCTYSYTFDIASKVKG
jgi:hypothetical protein